MHELSIAENVLDIVLQNVSPAELVRIRSVNMRIGAMAGVVPQSLEFSFHAITAKSPLSEAALAIEDVPFRVHCHTCNATMESPGGLGICPRCSGTDVRVVSGTELELVSIELAEESSEAL